MYARAVDDGAEQLQALRREEWGDLALAAVAVAAAIAATMTRPEFAVPLFLGGGQTFTCDGTAIPILPNVCSAGFQMGTLTADGGIENLEPVDASDLFSG